MPDVKAIPLEKFMCYKDPNGKRKVTVTTYIDQKNPKEEDIIFDGVYKLTLIKPYAENGKNPEMELVLDGSTEYNVSYIYRDYISDTDIPTYEPRYLDDTTFNYIINSKYKADPNFKSKLNNYCQCFDQELYSTIKDEETYEDYSKMEVKPDETDDPIAMIKDPDYIFGKRYDYLQLTRLYYEIIISTMFEYGTTVSITTDTKNFITKFIDKNEDPIHCGYRFEAIKDDNDNIVWQCSIMEITGPYPEPVVVGTPQIVNLADFYLEITGDVYENNTFDLIFYKIIDNYDKVFIPFIFDVEPYISD